MKLKRKQITLREAASLVGRSTETIRAWVRKGRLTRYQAGEEDNAPLLIDEQELLKVASEIRSSAMNRKCNAEGDETLIRVYERRINDLEEMVELFKRNEGRLEQTCTDLRADKERLLAEIDTLKGGKK